MAGVVLAVHVAVLTDRRGRLATAARLLGLGATLGVVAPDHAGGMRRGRVTQDRVQRRQRVRIPSDASRTSLLQRPEPQPGVLGQRGHDRAVPGVVVDRCRRVE